MKKSIKPLTLLGGFVVGIVNSLFGAGGGIIAVPLLQRAGLSKKESHANAVAVILPISVVSAILYLTKGAVEIGDATPYIFTGLIGSALGTVILRKINPVWLKRIFGVFVIYAGVRLLMK